MAPELLEVARRNVAPEMAAFGLERPKLRDLGQRDRTNGHASKARAIVRAPGLACYRRIKRTRPHEHLAQGNHTDESYRGRRAMDVPYYHCEDCGHEFAKTELTADVEDEPLACPVCGGLDLQLVESSGSGRERPAA